MMRLDKYISSASDYSRSDVKRLIKQGQVCINGIVQSNAGYLVKKNESTITLEGVLLKPIQPRYFMLNKPMNTVSATIDSQHPTVIDLINEPNSHNLQVVGRLDKDTTGLILLSDDGQWNHRVTSPKKACFKSYKVTVEKPLNDTMLLQLKQGIVLKNETKPTLPAVVEKINTHSLFLSICEGKYHQIKRMLTAVNNHVTQLHRYQIGSVVLDSRLGEGEYRPLSDNEIFSFGEP